MAQLKLTKTELRDQVTRLNQLKKYLPTLQLKKAMLQLEVDSAQNEINELRQVLEEKGSEIRRFAELLSASDAPLLNFNLQIKSLVKKYENIAGIDIPVIEEIEFESTDLYGFDLPVWYEASLGKIKTLLHARELLRCAMEKKEILAKELREVAIRVNLFEKVMIPRAVENIKKIKIFIGDQQLAAVCQAKVSKRKISERLKEENL